MSRSYRTLPKDILAIDRMPRDKKGAIIFPRIIVRQSKRGDIHPLDRKSIAIGFNAIPDECSIILLCRLDRSMAKQMLNVSYRSTSTQQASGKCLSQIVRRNICNELTQPC